MHDFDVPIGSEEQDMPRVRRTATVLYGLPIQSPAFDHAVLHLMLAFFAIIGVLARLGLNKLTGFEGAQYGGILWSNFAGCVIMGALVKCSKLFSDIIVVEDVGSDSSGHDKQRTQPPRHHRMFKAKGEIPLYTALSTGVPGNVTSFSSFMVSLFELSTRQPPNTVTTTYPNAGYGIMVFLSYFIITWCVSFGGLVLGIHLMEGFELLIPAAVGRYALFLEYLFALAGVLSWVAVLVVAITVPSWRFWSLSCVFGPFGVYSRFWLSRLFNKISKKFMVGTFIANITATALISALIILQFGKSSSGGNIVHDLLKCQITAAFENGFCGNLSTVSSFVAEMYAMRSKRNAYVYGITTNVVGFCVIVVMAGSYSWVNGFTTSVCQTS